MINSQPSNDLIFDVGAHQGEDAAYYLAKGFRVVAIEANPALCRGLAERFEREISNRTLTIVNKAIAETAGEVTFYVDKRVSVWGTTNIDWVKRNASLGAGDVEAITVESVPLSFLVREYGLPRYCKIDIEGNDVAALKSFGEVGAPDFVSIESEKVSWQKLMKEFEVLCDLGFRKFKIVDQSIIQHQRCPIPAREGRDLDYRFEEGSSGLFGEELPGKWLDLFEAIEAYKAIFRGYALVGDNGIFSGSQSAFRKLDKVYRRIQSVRGKRLSQNPIETLPPAGWYDTHASK